MGRQSGNAMTNHAATLRGSDDPSNTFATMPPAKLRLRASRACRSFLHVQGTTCLTYISISRAGAESCLIFINRAAAIGRQYAPAAQMNMPTPPAIRNAKASGTRQ